MKLFKRLLAMLTLIAVTMSGFAFAETAESALAAEIAAIEPAVLTEETASEEAPAEEAVSEDAPIEEAPAAEIPAGEAPAEEGGAAAPLSPCDHPKEYVGEYRRLVSAEAIDGRFHLATYNVYQEMYCPICDYSIPSDGYVTVVEELRHCWDEDDQCWDCGYVNPCSHADQETIEIYENISVLSSDETMHTIEGDLVYHYWCPDCRRETIEITDQRVTVTQPHRWDGDFCSVCKAVNNCTHPNKQIRNDYQEIVRLISADAESHTAEMYYNINFFCPDCGFDGWYNPSEITVETLPHEWYEGKCDICGYENSCTHENGGRELYNYEEIVEVISTTAKEHTLSICKVYVYACADCKQEYSVSDVEPRTVTRSHNWNEKGVCWDCEAINSCAHENLREDGRSREAEQVISSDAEQHSCLFRDIIWMYCPDCEFFTSQRGEETYTLTEPHTWQEGCCEFCGYENSCTHENRYVEYTSDSVVRVLSSDAKTHTIEYRQEHMYVCPDCGEESWELEETVLTKTANHEWYEGKCYLCDAINSCKHESKSLSYDFWYVLEVLSKDAKSHTVMVQDYDLYTCNDCGEQFEEVQGKPYQKKEAHWWHRGACDTCGQKNACDHENTAVSVFCDFSNAVSVNSRIHSYTSKLLQQTICIDCGNVQEKLLESDTQLENHSFENGKCQICDYTNSCSHKNTQSREVKWYLTADAKDSKSHTITQAKYLITECTDCGEEISRKEKDTIKENRGHNLNAANICDQCGYEASCTHPKLKTETGEFKECISYNAASHKLRKYTESFSVCTSCGCAISNAYTSSYTDLGLEAHSFKDGRCTECGMYEIECEHEYANGKCIHCGKAEKVEIYAMEALGLIVGDTGSLYAKIINGSGTLEYSSSNRSVASVSDDGTVTARKCGTATITISCGEAEVSCEVTVYEAPKAVKLSKSKLTLGLDDTAQLSAEISPSKAFPDIGWCSSDNAVATVDANGLVTPVGVGSAIITAYSELYFDIYADCAVTVVESAGEIVLDVSELTLAVKDKYTLNASVLPENTEAELSYSSSDSKVASVSSKGLITAKKAGSAVITVSTENGLEKTVAVTVLKAPSKVTLNLKNLTVGEGENFQLTAEIPEGSYTSSYKWTSSKASVASVDENGFVTVHAVGKANITVKTSNGKSAKCAVTVLASPESISLSAGTLKLGEGQSAELKVTLPKKTASSIVWSCSGDAVRVSDGAVTALKAGTATVTATAVSGGASASCTVTVLKAPDSIAVESALDMAVKEKFTLSAVPMAGEEAAGGVCSFSLKSGKGIITVDDETGLITAKKTGSAVVTVETYNGVTADCSVTVHAAPKSVKLSATKKTLAVGESFELTASVSPANALNKGFTVTISKEGIASVAGENGVYTVTAATEGKVKITIASANGKKASCTVTVK